ncbi:uncharacterized protein DSM5745_05972 [Aspergillus mulundensis]|uniref:Uncharacterized protein n=1 Tax=Aspergillus mulundensis TaxID=1810919 RepID=A0A3D8RZ31_9EURO|nr:hypothetical protein DSM5745_05972 [Aspergillus mulundensis]RDW79120.1 hypothetical protein DSM5745_05972 [Aspergillus mulundensis]
MPTVNPPVLQGPGTSKGEELKGQSSCAVEEHVENDLDPQYHRLLQSGLLELTSEPTERARLRTDLEQDVINYCRTVIEAPEDTSRRAKAEWIKSTSAIFKQLMHEFGPEIIDAARRGCEAIVADHYHGDSTSIAHVNKKANFLRHIPMQIISSAFYPATSPLAIGCYETGTLPCSIALSAWLPPKQALQAGTICHLSICDDYHAFTEPEREVRHRMVAIAVGAAFLLGPGGQTVLLDGSTLQAAGDRRGSHSGATVRAAMSWRAVSGGGTGLTGYHYGHGSLGEGLIGPKVAIAMHDLLDWRCDAAAKNHENGVSAIYGLGVPDPFHVYLEAMLREGRTHPRSAAYAMGGVVYMSFTAVRYGSYEYKGGPWAACPECERLLREVTAGSGLRWMPVPPPQSFEEGEWARQLSREVVDGLEQHPLAQHGLAWLQHLVLSGQIRLFDALVDIDSVDATVDWS